MANFQGCMFLLLISLVSIIMVRAILTRKQTKARRPPSPPSLPIIGHLHLLSPLPHQALHKLSTRFGPIMQLFLGSVPCYIVSTPETAKEFLKTHELSFSNRIPSGAIEHLSYGFQGFIFAPYGPYWKFMKKLFMSELLGGRTLDQLLPVRQQETMRFLRFLLKKSQVGEAVDVGGELVTLTNNTISRMIMSQLACSHENDNEAENIRKLVADTSELAGRFNVSDYIWFCKNLDFQGIKKRVKKVRERFDDMLERVINEREEKRKKRKENGDAGTGIKDVLDILLDIYEDERSEVKLTKGNIKALILDIFLAGSDTSALTIEWAMAQLINNPQVMEKARQEIYSVIGKNRIAEESDIINLPYMQAIVKETLRLHPPGPIIGRISSESCIVLGYEIPANSPLYINTWAIGRDPNHWEDPLEFRPERFMDKRLDVRGQNFQLIPFGSGRRGCPGISLALQVVPTNLAAMIQCFEWKVDGGNRTVDMEEKPGITLARAHPLICVPVSRLDSFPSI